MGRLIAVGDIHGCLAALQAIVQAVQPRPTDEFVFLGDYVDRGPDSAGVIDFLLELSRSHKCTFLLGNHECMFINYLEENATPSENGGTPELTEWKPSDWLMCGGAATLNSYASRGTIAADHVKFFVGLKRYYETAEFFFVHANYEAETPLDEQPDYLLVWEHLTLSVPPPHENGKTAIVGHTAQRTGEVLDLGHIVCIDTCCYGGRWLTAMDVHTRQVWQANMAGEMRE